MLVSANVCLPLEDHDVNSAYAGVMHEGGLCLWYLARTRISPELKSEFVDHSAARSADRVTTRQEPAIRVDGDAPGDFGVPFPNERAARTGLAEPKLLDQKYFSRAERVVHLGDVYVVRSKTGLLVRRS